MKKDILFVIPSLGVGGAEKALVNLLNIMDYDKYNVDLFVFNHNGVFMKFVPEQVNLLSLPQDYLDFSMSLRKSIKTLLKKRKLNILKDRIFFTKENYLKRKEKHIDQYNWRYMKDSFGILDKEYDVAIGYLEKSSIYFCIDNVKSKKKIGFIHNDYDKLGLNAAIDNNYFKYLDSIVTVSKECLDVLKNRFPNESSKMSFMYNIVSPKVINNMSKEKVEFYNATINLVSVGRLNYQKGYDLAIEVCGKLIKKGYDIKWNIIGDGEERTNLEKLIKEYNLEDRFVLLGIKENPYPYVRNADIYVQTSRFEGKSIAIDEAKILNKPILITNFSTAKDQISNGENGLIVDMDIDSIFKGLEELINDEDLRNKLTNNLSKEKLGTENEINKLYSLF